MRPGEPTMNESAELWIRLKDGRSFCERYNQLEMAEFVRESMLDCVSRDEPLFCYDGDKVEIPADLVKRIDLLLSHETRAPHVV